MSKYISTRIEKINKLTEKLNNINTKINDCITILEKIKKEHNNFNIHYSILNDINEDLNIKSFDYNFYFLFENYYSYSIHIDYNVKKNIPDQFKIVLSIINENINFSVLADYIFTGHCMYFDIKKLYFEIKLKQGLFAKTSNKLIAHFKKLMTNQIIENDEKFFYGYFFAQKDNKDENIYFVYQTYQYGSNYLYQVKLPLIDHVEQIYSVKNSNNQYNKELYITIFKELFLKLNQDFFNFLNIDENSIDFRFDLDSMLSNFDVDYTKSHTYNLHIEPLNQLQINIILDKLELEKN